MREIFRGLTSFGGDLSEDEIEAQIDERMMNDPRFSVLSLSCVAPDGSGLLTIVQSSASKYADVPFAPGSYVIEAGEVRPFGGIQAPGAFGVALMTLGDAWYNATTDGTIDITKFDTSGIAGTFNFGARERSRATDGRAIRTITVHGSFDFDCIGSSVCD